MFMNTQTMYESLKKTIDSKVKDGLEDKNFWNIFWIDEYGFSHPRTATTYSSGCILINNIDRVNTIDTSIIDDLVKEAREYVSHTSLKERNNIKMPKIKEVIFNNPATIIYWRDGTKTVVKCQPEDTYDKEKGFIAACMKKICGNDNTFNKIINEWCNNSENINSKEVIPKKNKNVNK